MGSSNKLSLGLNVSAGELSGVEADCQANGAVDRQSALHSFILMSRGYWEGRWVSLQILRISAARKAESNVKISQTSIFRPLFPS